MPQATHKITSAAALFAAILFTFCCYPVKAHASELADAAVSANDAVTASVCPVVYSLDQYPGQSFHYVFYGNAFFINKDGYLLTAAHVVSAFRDGGQPEILVGPADGPRQLLRAEVVAADWAHDVAVLRATPNPFAGNIGVRYLQLTLEKPAAGRGLTLVSKHPNDPENGDSAEAPLVDRVSGKMMHYEYSYGETEGSGRELLAVSQEVVPGESGSPVVANDSHEVVGLVLGRWLRPDLISLAAAADLTRSSPGAILPIHYAVALLHSRAIPWQAAAGQGQAARTSDGNDTDNPFPVPISIVGTPYPAQALFGGEVVLDALIDSDGKLANLTVVRGQTPFLGAVVDAVRTWSFEPAHANGRAIDSHIGIVFQFAQSFLPPLAPLEHKYVESTADSGDHAAVPTYTKEPEYPANTVEEGNVALYATVDQQGQLNTPRVLEGIAPLTSPTIDATRQWRFAPGTQNGTAGDSAVIVVETFRRPTLH